MASMYLLSGTNLAIWQLDVKSLHEVIISNAFSPSVESSNQNSTAIDMQTMIHCGAMVFKFLSQDTISSTHLLLLLPLK